MEFITFKEILDRYINNHHLTRLVSLGGDVLFEAFIHMGSIYVDLWSYNNDLFVSISHNSLGWYIPRVESIGTYIFIFPENKFNKFNNLYENYKNQSFNIKNELRLINDIMSLLTSKYNSAEFAKRYNLI
jgi:hypothetical protein